MEPTLAPEQPPYNEDEWVALEEELDTRFEFLDGYLYDVRAMSQWGGEAGALLANGGTIPHGRACSNVAGELRAALREAGRKCSTYTSEVKIQVEQHRRYYYPDASVRCGEEEPGDRTGSYRNPTIVVEVVSKSSLYRDTVTKLKHYTALESLRDYVLVYLTEAVVHVLSRATHEEPMTVTAYGRLDDRVHLPSLDVSVTTSELYAEVEFPPEAKVVDHPNRNREDGEPY